MEGQTAFCDACYSIAFEIESYYQFLKARFAHGEQLSESPTGAGADKTISLGTWEHLQSRLGCTSCQDIARKLIHDGNTPLAHTELNFRVDRDQGLWIRGALRLDATYLDLWRLEYPNQAHEVGRLFSPQLIDIDLLHKWINCCYASHGERCHNVELPIPLHHIYLIDVDEGCLVSASIETRYIALSYVWGNVETLQTTKNNLTHLKKPRSIGVDLGSLKISNTIKDALQLVALVGERYLWVDCLCIVQDELDTKQACLNAMGSIYSNAIFTIVAADGHNADHGLRGLGHGSENGTRSCDIVRFPHQTDVLVHRPRAASSRQSLGI